MNRKSNIFLVLLFFFHFNAITIEMKKIVIFMSDGGAGHVAVSNALKNYLQNKYEISVVNFFEKVIPSIDTFRSLTFGKYSGENVYNFLLRHRFANLIKGYTYLGNWGLRRRSQKIEKLTIEYLKKNNADMIISVIPFINSSLLAVAKNLNIPFLIVTNDLDTTNYINGINKPDYKKFYYTLAFDDTEMRKKIDQANIPANQIKVIGFPLRPEFFQKTDKEKTYEDFKIPRDKKIITIITGGAGSYTSYNYVNELSRLNKKAHIIICLGKNAKMRKNIENIKLSKNMSITILDFTNRIADLLSITDIPIIKPGPNSIFENIELELPMIIDNTEKAIWWEQMNIDFVKRNGFGEIITNIRQLGPALDKLLYDTKYTNVIKEKMRKFKQKSSFEKNIKKLVDEILIQ